MMNRKVKRKRIITAVSAMLLLALVLWIAWGNTALELNTYTIQSPHLPDSFVGFKIAHISDLHNTQIGSENETLITMLRDSDPDIIAITGDMIDSRRTNVEVALKFAEEAIKIAPCYYVTGNHEARISAYKDLKEGLTNLGVIVLEDERTELTRGEEHISLIGVHDPSFKTDYLLGDSAGIMTLKLQELKDENASFTILLSHRPELFEVYAENGMNLVLSGHAHGGQFRLPFIGGLVAPNQGFFPKYDSGLYSEETTNMIVSRGIGNSAFPFRFNNRPEEILIELQKT